MFGPRDITVVMGRRDCGKSYLGQRVQSAYPRKIIFDTMLEYDGENGAVVCSTFDEFCDELIRIEQSKPASFTLIVHFDIERENRSEELNECLKLLYKYQSGILIVVEEVHTFVTPHSMPLWLRNCLTLGAHLDHAMIITTQRPGLCHKLIVSQAEHIFCGQMHDPADIDYAKTILRDRALELIDLPVREFLYFSPGKPIIKVRNSLD